VAHEGTARPKEISYLGLLKTPGALSFVVPGIVGRLPQGMIGIGTVLMIAQLRDSYALAGSVAAALALAQGVCAPMLGRLADRWGQSRVALGGTAIHIPALVGLVLAATWEAPTWTLFVTAALAGATVPVLGAFSRVRWSIITERTGGWDRALALESIIDEVVFITGPVLATFLTVSVAPPAALVVAAVTAGVGVLGFVTARSSEPTPSRGARTAGQSTRAPVILASGMIPLALVLLAMGAFFGGVDVTVVAFTEAAGTPAMAGVILGVFSLSSLVGGVLYGSRTWRASPPVRFAWSATALGAATMLVPFAYNQVWLGIALGVVGLAVAPTLIGGNALVATLVRPAALTEGFTWLTVAIFVGVAAGAPITGAVIDQHGAAPALWMAPAIGAALIGLGWLAARAATRAAAMGEQPTAPQRESAPC